MSKKSTALWREALLEVNLEVKSVKIVTFAPLLDIQASTKCIALLREARLEVKMYKAHHVGTTFGSCDVAKVHGVVARNIFGSEHITNTRGLDHF